MQGFLEIIKGQSEASELFGKFIRLSAAQGAPVEGSARYGNRLRSSGLEGFDGAFGNLTGTDHQ